MPNLLPKRVLVVDDDEADFVILRAYLEKAGVADAEWCPTTDEALRRMFEGGHDLYLLDYHIDRRTGIQLLEEARAAGFMGPVILLTGAEDAEVALAGARAGASDFLAKSRVDSGELRRALMYATSQHRLETERVKRTEAEASVRLKDEFVAAVAHELRTPIHAIRLASQLLANGTTDPAMEQPLELLRSNVARLGRLVEDILDTARQQQGELMLRMEEVEIGAVVTSALRYHQVRAAAGGVELDVDVEPVVLVGDGTRIGQVADNLVGNALRFTPRGGKITVTTRRSGDAAVLTVRDTGPGVPEQIRTTIFEAYSQESAGGSRGAGLGLGLFLVRAITEAHGGSASVRNDGGAVFEVVFPLAGPPVDATGSAEEEPGDGADAGSHGEGHHRQP